MKIKKFEDLDQEKLYASGPESTPGERLRNFLSPYFTYFAIIDKGELDRDHEILKKLEKQCYDNLPYVRYWLNEIE
jgi:hypothetical protein